jgi:putative transposase
VARLARVEVLETPHHVTQRGNARRAVFETDNDRLAYLSILGQHAKSRGLSIRGYCLMPNHVHLVVVPVRKDAMARVLRDAHGRYATYLNARQAADGHVWQGRYYSCPMDDQHLWNALRYIERNPVRAGLAQRPEDWVWSSARVHLCGVHDGLTELGEWASHWIAADWREFVETPAREVDEAIRRSTHAGRPLGSKEFVQRLENATGRRLTPGKGGRPKKCVEAAAILWGVS